MEDISVLGFCDMNVPWARVKEVSENLCKGVAAINADGKTSRNASIILLPDLARDKNPRGLYDEERQIFEKLFSRNQHIDARFVECFSRDKKGEVRSNSRRFSAGRIVTNMASSDECIWLQGDLALHGRPVGLNEKVELPPCNQLPKQADLLNPESSNVNSDLRLADRPKPSPEQAAAQKGVQRAMFALGCGYQRCLASRPCPPR